MKARRTAGTRALFIAGFLLVGPSLHAQGAGMAAVENYVLQHAEDAARHAAETLRPQVTPAAVIFAPTMRRVSVQVTNPLDSVVTIALTLRQTTPQPDATGVLVPDSLAPASARAYDMSGWVHGMPTELTLGPHATQALALTVTPPATPADGEYWTTLTAVVRHTTVHTTLIYQGQAISGTWPIPFDLVTRVPLLYRQGTLRAGLTLGTPTATVAGDSLVRVCLPLHHSGGARAAALVMVRVPAGVSAFDSTTDANGVMRLPLAVGVDMTPCVPVLVGRLAPGTYTADVRVIADSQTLTPLPPFSPQQARVAFTLTAAAQAAAATARARDTIKDFSNSVFASVLLQPKEGSLSTALADEVHKARQQGRTPVLDVGATWCGPCHLLDRMLRRPEVRETLRGMYVIHMEGDLWGDRLSEIGLDGMVFPVLLRLGRDGHPVGKPKYGVQGLDIAPGVAQPGEDVYAVMARQVAAELQPFFASARAAFTGSP